MIDPQQQIAIRTALQDFRQQGLKDFLDQFVPLLQQEGFSTNDLLAALATWANGQENSQLLTRYLEDAATEAQRISSR